MENVAHPENGKECFATIEKPFHFVDSGLPNVYLVGIRYFVCEDGRITAEIPAIKQLMRFIARDLVEKPQALTGCEIRFLRKRLGKKQADFARELGLRAETLSRMETDETPAGERNDKLIRLYYAVASGDQILQKQMQQALEEILSSWTRKRSPKKIVASVKGNQWKPIAA